MEPISPELSKCLLPLASSGQLNLYNTQSAASPENRFED